MMNEQKFQKLVDTFGSQPDRWPEDVREHARAFINTHPELAEAMMQDESTLDAWLDELPRSEPSDLLRRRILNQAKSEIPPVELSRFGRPWMGVAAMILAAFIAGYGLGQWGPVSEENSRLEAQIMDEDLYEMAALDTAWQSAATDLGISDIYSWAEDGT